MSAGMSYLPPLSLFICPPAPSRFAGVAQIDRLKSLHWHGISNGETCRIIHQCLSRNAGHLESLKIGLAKPFWRTLRSILCSRPHSLLSLVCLRDLSLSRVSLESMADLLSAIPVHNLQALALHTCDNQDRLLAFAAATGAVHRLRTFEMTYGGEEAENLMTGPVLVRFLERCTRLRNLHLRSLNGVGSVGLLSELVIRHPTLRRVVLHDDLEFPDGVFFDATAKQIIHRLFIGSINELGLVLSPLLAVRTIKKSPVWY